MHHSQCGLMNRGQGGWSDGAWALHRVLQGSSCGPSGPPPWIVDRGVRAATRITVLHREKNPGRSGGGKASNIVPQHSSMDRTGTGSYRSQTQGCYCILSAPIQLTGPSLTPMAEERNRFGAGGGDIAGSMEPGRVRNVRKQ